MNLYALHGFLGTPRDWEALREDFSIPLHSVSLSHVAPPAAGLNAWARAFNRQVSQIQTTQNVLLGYSLGGRLALHALIAQPTLWSGAIIVSANTGIVDLEERHKRMLEDRIWAQRFMDEPWDALMSAWNKQDVFKGRGMLERKESDFSRRNLAGMLEGWSLGCQEDLRPFLLQQKIPILWVVGQDDHSYVSIANAMARGNEKFQVCVAPHAAHRVPWEVPNLFTDAVNHFLKALPPQDLHPLQVQNPQEFSIFSQLLAE